MCMHFCSTDDKVSSKRHHHMPLKQNPHPTEGIRSRRATPIPTAPDALSNWLSDQNADPLEKLLLLLIFVASLFAGSQAGVCSRRLLQGVGLAVTLGDPDGKVERIAVRSRGDQAGNASAWSGCQPRRRWKLAIDSGSGNWGSLEWACHDPEPVTRISSLGSQVAEGWLSGSRHLTRNQT